MKPGELEVQFVGGLDTPWGGLGLEEQLDGGEEIAWPTSKTFPGRLMACISSERSPLLSTTQAHPSLLLRSTQLATPTSKWVIFYPASRNIQSSNNKLAHHGIRQSQRSNSLPVGSRPHQCRKKTWHNRHAPKPLRLHDMSLCLPRLHDVRLRPRSHGLYPRHAKLRSPFPFSYWFHHPRLACLSTGTWSLVWCVVLWVVGG